MVAAMHPQPAFAHAPMLSAGEMQDLAWFFDGAEGSFGVRSNFGAMEDELIRRSLSDEAKIELQTLARKRTMLKRVKTGLRELQGGLAALYSAVGLPPPSVPDLPEAEDLLPTWAQQYMRLHVGSTHVDVEPTIDLKLAARASHTRARLKKLGSNWTGVLYAAYGPASAKWEQESYGNPDHPVTRLGNPALGEICMAVLAWERSSNQPSPYEMLFAECATGKGTLKLRNKAMQLLWDANGAYLQTRCAQPPQVHKTRVRHRAPQLVSCTRCWPQ